MIRQRLRAVLFDLDGTLVHSLPSLLRAMNAALIACTKPPVDLAILESAVTGGTAEMVRASLRTGASDNLQAQLRERFLAEYEADPATGSALYAGMRGVLSSLDQAQIPWGIVTNKLTRYTQPLVRKLMLDSRASCIVCGDTTEASKPHPAPLLHAANMLGVEPAAMVYAGDAPTDITAARAAGMTALAAAWGYLPPDGSPLDWGADAVVETPAALHDWLFG